jgi:hypothetical protein
MNVPHFYTEVVLLLFLIYLGKCLNVTRYYRYEVVILLYILYVVSLGIMEFHYDLQIICLLNILLQSVFHIQ